MSKKTKFDYREFLEKGFETLDDDFLNQHFGSSSSSSSSEPPVESSNINKAAGFHHSPQFKYPIVKTLAMQEVKPNGGTPPYMAFHGSNFTQHFLQNLSQTQKIGLKNGCGYVEVPLLDDNTGQFYDAKLVFHRDSCYLVEIDQLIKDRQLKARQQMAFCAHFGVLHFICPSQKR